MYNFQMSREFRGSIAVFNSMDRDLCHFGCGPCDCAVGILAAGTQLK